MDPFKIIYNNLGLVPGLEEEKEKFNNRLKKLITFIDKFKQHKRFLNKFLLYSGLGHHYSLEGCFGDDFEINILNLQYILYIIKKDEFSTENKILSQEERNFIEEAIKKIFNLSLLDLGYNYQNGYIIKAGAKELDEKLIIDNLDWLDDFKETKKYFENAVTFNMQEKYNDSLTNCYSALENIVQKVLNNNRTLQNDEQIINFLQKMEIDSWNGVLKNYCNIANNFSSRHGGKNPTIKLTKELSEFYLYMTGSFIRLIIQRMNTKYAK